MVTKMLTATLALACCLTLSGMAANPLDKHLFFSGYEWEVKSGSHDPGNNNWSADNVWVDQDGLHLKITWNNGQWHCAELLSVPCFSYGSYEFQVIGSLDQLDTNTVLGLFVYPCPENPNPDNEIDIEFTGWGNQTGIIGNYTVTAAKETYRFPFSLEGSYTTHRFNWTPTQILFQSFHGHAAYDAVKFGNWLYQAADYDGRQIMPPVRVHLNLWLFSGKPPANNAEQEVIIKKFIFSPARL